MKNINTNQWLQFAFVLIPLILSIVFCFINNGFVLAAAVLSLFLLVGLLPVCKKRENLWMFLFSAISLLPVNIYLALWAYQWLAFELYDDSRLFLIANSLLILHMAFCIEQILLGILTRFLWKKQYRVEVE